VGLQLPGSPSWCCACSHAVLLLCWGASCDVGLIPSHQTGPGEAAKQGDKHRGRVTGGHQAARYMPCCCCCCCSRTGAAVSITCTALPRCCCSCPEAHLMQNQAVETGLSCRKHKPCPPSTAFAQTELVCSCSPSFCPA
jgi:hypothetical protein